MSDEAENMDLESPEMEQAPGEFDISAILPAALAALAEAKEAFSELAATNELAARCTLARAFVFRENGKFGFAKTQFENCFRAVAAGMEEEANQGENPENPG